ncbi:uncharacterized protein [Tenebrio molitor]|uniref:uncharacterized protein n=1 Tax=Tenebrio molitor TaxID=7067 RepID=UPI0036246B88
MTGFMFLVVLTMGGLAEHGKIVEGHSLAARFTSNPIFLRHFGGGHEQQVVWPRVVLFRASSVSDDEYEDSEEESGFRPSVEITEDNLDSKLSVDSEIENDLVASEEQESDEEIETHVFKLLPLFERTHVFKAQEAIEEEQDQANDDPVLYFFKSLPLFNRSQSFKQPTQNLTAKSPNSVVYIFRSVPHFERLHEFKSSIEAQNETSKSPESVQVALAYFFKSLPHYEIAQNFHKASPAPFVSKIKHHEDTIEENVAFRTLSHLDDAIFSRPHRRRLVKVVKKKKLKSGSVNEKRVEFGRRLTPRVKSVGDLQLDTSASTGKWINSYGGLESSQK